LTVAGYLAGYSNTTGTNNSAFGDRALAFTTTGVSNTAVGTQALNQNTTASNNTAVGYQALYTNTTGTTNVAVGRRALYLNVTGTSNVAVGEGTLESNTANFNTALGHNALSLNNTGINNTGVGYQAGLNNTTGSNNTFVGRLTGYSNTTSFYNTAMGSPALYLNTTGAANAAYGDASLYNNTTGSNNTGLGISALQSNTTASNNTGVGYRAGYSNVTGVSNVFIGESAGYNTTTNSNTFVGQDAGYLVTTGANNTILGGYNGNQGGLDIRTASNYIVLSDGDGNPRAACGTNGSWQFTAPQSGGEVAIFTNTSLNPYGSRILFSAANPNNTSSYFLYCDDSAAQRATIRSNGGLANYSGNDANLSDRREKTNFAPAKSYLDVICAIPVQTFNYIDQNMEEDGGLTLGVVAQDVQAVAPELVMESNWGTEDEPKMRLSIYQTDLQYALMKCIQEQQALIETLTQRITALEGR
jgi:hypothetical protein